MVPSPIEACLETYDKGEIIAGNLKP